MSQRRAFSVAIVYILSAAYLFATHYRLLNLPFFWDEAGQFIPQAWDLFRKGLILPESALPNSHPPGLPLLLAGYWNLVGFGIAETRCLMLLLGAAYLTSGFLLAVELLRGAHGTPAFLAIGLLAAQPLVYTQSMMAQLDLPSALFLTALFVAYLRRKETFCLVFALLAVAFKETALLVPIVLAAFSWRQGARRFALLLAGLPILLLANWFGFLYLKTGFAFGDGEYSQYNLIYPLHPVRLAYALFRRASFLLVENLHLLPASVLVWRWKEIGFSPVWRPIAAACAVYSLGVSVSGGAVLERYLLPVIPVLCAAFAAALSTLGPRLRYGIFGISAAGILGCLFLNMPWPYALENNLAMVDLVEIQRNAAGLVESRMLDRRVTTTWPMSDALRKPYLGYLQTRHPNVRTMHEASFEAINSLAWEPGDVLILYSRSWQPSASLAAWQPARWLLDRFFAMPRDLRQEQIDRLAGFRPVIGYEQRGLWIEILIVPRN